MNDRTISATRTSIVLEPHHDRECNIIFDLSRMPNQIMEGKETIAVGGVDEQHGPFFDYQGLERYHLKNDRLKKSCVSSKAVKNMTRLLKWKARFIERIDAALRRNAQRQPVARQEVCKQHASHPRIHLPTISLPSRHRRYSLSDTTDTVASVSGRTGESSLTRSFRICPWNLDKDSISEKDCDDGNNEDRDNGTVGEKCYEGGDIDTDDEVEYDNGSERTYSDDEDGDWTYCFDYIPWGRSNSVSDDTTTSLSERQLKEERNNPFSPHYVPQEQHISSNSDSNSNKSNNACRKSPNRQPTIGPQIDTIVQQNALPNQSQHSTVTTSTTQTEFCDNRSSHHVRRFSSEFEYGSSHSDRIDAYRLQKLQQHQENQSKDVFEEQNNSTMSYCRSIPSKSLYISGPAYTDQFRRRTVASELPNSVLNLTANVPQSKSQNTNVSVHQLTNKESELCPGIFGTLRAGIDETNRAFVSGTIVFPTCIICSTDLICVSYVEYVLCQNCKVMTPIINLEAIQQRQQQQHDTDFGGLGIGLPTDDLIRTTEAETFH